jgi:hypothetical protein
MEGPSGTSLRTLCCRGAVTRLKERNPGTESGMNETVRLECGVYGTDHKRIARDI